MSIKCPVFVKTRVSGISFLSFKVVYTIHTGLYFVIMHVCTFVFFCELCAFVIYASDTHMHNLKNYHYHVGYKKLKCTSYYKVKRIELACFHS